jgi:hypothetical protein
LALSDPTNIKIIRSRFITVAANDWFERQRRDAAGKFFRSVANQGPRTGEGGSTRQGFYALTATGKLLMYRNTHDTLWFRDFLQSSIKAWDRLPAGDRQIPGHKLPKFEVDEALHHTVPNKAIVLNARSRILNRDSAGQYQEVPVPRGEKAFGHLTALDHVWILEEEWTGLLRQAKVAAGRQFLLPKRLSHRLARFHCWDNTRGEAAAWENGDIKLLKIIVKSTAGVGAGKESTAFELGGSMILSNKERTFVARLRGELEFDPRTKRPTRFDLIVVGDHQGDGPYTKGGRPGFAPLGIHFTLADPKKPQDSIPPQEIRWPKRYYEAEK